MAAQPIAQQHWVKQAESISRIRGHLFPYPMSWSSLPNAATWICTKWSPRRWDRMWCRPPLTVMSPPRPELFLPLPQTPLPPYYSPPPSDLFRALFTSTGGHNQCRPFCWHSLFVQCCNRILWHIPSIGKVTAMLGLCTSRIGPWERTWAHFF